VGGGWPGRPDATTQFPQEMLVDTIRIYRWQEPVTTYRLQLPFMNYTPGNMTRRTPITTKTGTHRRSGLLAGQSASHARDVTYGSYPIFRTGDMPGGTDRNENCQCEQTRYTGDIAEWRAWYEGRSHDGTTSLNVRLTWIP